MTMRRFGRPLTVIAMAAIVSAAQDTAFSGSTIVRSRSMKDISDDLLKFNDEQIIADFVIEQEKARGSIANNPSHSKTVVKWDKEVKTKKRNPRAKEEEEKHKNMRAKEDKKDEIGSGVDGTESTPRLVIQSRIS